MSILDHFNELSYFRGDENAQGMKQSKLCEEFHAAGTSALLLSVCYIPLVFVAYCRCQEKKIFARYDRNVLVCAFLQGAVMLPYTLLSAWQFFFVKEDLKTTVLWCSVVFDTVSLGVILATMIPSVRMY